MSLETILANHKTIMESVSGIGQVYNRQRVSRSYSLVLNALRKGTSINGWMTSRIKTEETTETLGSTIGGGNKQHIRIHHLMTKGVFEIDDANDSEATFQNLIEAICAAFRIKPTLDGACISIYGPEPEKKYGIQVDEVTYHFEEENATLYHACTLSLFVQEMIS